MATKTIAWTTGSGNITLTYTGHGNGSISVSSSENDSFDDRSQSFNIVTTNGSPEQAVSILVKQKGKTFPVGEVFNFAYTGSVQQITLPKGKYKLQCWGAQGGTSYGSSSGVGSKGGYSEGVITITQPTTFYIFVGGQGSRGSSSSLVNGGWNGGGASVGYSSYNSSGTNGYSYPACGGGATDISTVTSTMSYSSGRTNRSSASLLARCIVAGGGAGGSYRHTSVTTTSTSTTQVASGSMSKQSSSGEVLINSITSYPKSAAAHLYSFSTPLKAGVTYKFVISFYLAKGLLAWVGVSSSSSVSTAINITGSIYGNDGSVTVNYTPSTTINWLFVIPNSTCTEDPSNIVNIDVYADEGAHYGYTYYKSLGALSPSTKYDLSLSGGSYDSVTIQYYKSSGSLAGTLSGTSFTTPSTSYSDFKVVVEGCTSAMSYTLYKEVTTTDTSTSSGYSSGKQQGGGTSGGGQYPGGQTSSSSGGGFGYGANQASTNWRYCSGGGGGGWYGGGASQSDTSTSYINYGGGGSGFVNIFANAASRPSGYTGLQLDSGTTIGGGSSFPSTSGGSETGHSGNGYARITVLE